MYQPSPIIKHDCSFPSRSLVAAHPDTHMIADMELQGL